MGHIDESQPPKEFFMYDPTVFSFYTVFLGGGQFGFVDKLVHLFVGGNFVSHVFLS